MRNMLVDTGKGIAIILMCIGHAYCPDALFYFIYMFHMAFFFMMSGYFFSDKNLDNPKAFIWKRITGLWVPFVKWGLIFVLLHNIFLKLQLLPPPPFENNVYSIREAMWKGLTTIPRFIPTEDMMGPYWFLSCLFFTSILSWVIFRMGKLFKQYRSVVTGALFLLCYSVGCVFVYLDIKCNVQIKLALVVSILFYLGFLWKRYDGCVRYTIAGVLTALTILLAGYFLGYDHINIATLNLENPTLFLVYSLCGCYLVLGVSSFINKNSCMKNVLSYVGRHSITILLANYFCIRVLHLIRYYFMPDNHGAPTDIPQLYNDWYWWMVYTLFSVVVPLGVREIYQKIKESIIIIKSKSR